MMSPPTFRKLFSETISLPWQIDPDRVREIIFAMKNPAIAPSLIAALAFSSSAQAGFHLFDIQEIYTNGAGTVQFVELFTTDGNQPFLNGHTLTFLLNGVQQNSFTFPSNLVGSTANKSVLIGTANLTTLYGVTPDFVIPANFFTAGANNFVNFGEGFDIVNLGGLPNDGTSSLNGLVGDPGTTSASTSVNSQATPKNFAGQTATIPEPTGVTLGLLTLGAAMLRRRRA